MLSSLLSWKLLSGCCPASLKPGRQRRAVAAPLRHQTPQPLSVDADVPGDPAQRSLLRYRSAMRRCAPSKRITTGYRQRISAATSPASSACRCGQIILAWRCSATAALGCSNSAIPYGFLVNRPAGKRRPNRQRLQSLWRARHLTASAPSARIHSVRLQLHRLPIAATRSHRR